MMSEEKSELLEQISLQKAEIAELRQSLEDHVEVCITHAYFFMMLLSCAAQTASSMSKGSKKRRVVTWDDILCTMDGIEIDSATLKTIPTPEAFHDNDADGKKIILGYVNLDNHMDHIIICKSCKGMLF